MMDESLRKVCENAMYRAYLEAGVVDTHPINPETGKPTKAIIAHPDLLRELYIDQGLRYAQICAILSCSRRTMSRLIKRAGIPRRLPTQDRQARAWEFGGHEKWINGYVYVYCPEHPQANKRGYIAKHRLVMEQQLGRYLGPDEVVHHINRLRCDNRPENLMVMDREAHIRLHSDLRQKPKPHQEPRKPKVPPEQIIDLYHAGLHDREIAARLKRSVSWARANRTRLGLPRLPHPDKKINDTIAMEMYRAGASNSQIATRFGVSKHTVSSWRRVNGLPKGENKFGCD